MLRDRRGEYAPPRNDIFAYSYASVSRTVRLEARRAGSTLEIVPMIRMPISQAKMPERPYTAGMGAVRMARPTPVVSTTVRVPNTALAAIVIFATAWVRLDIWMLFTVTPAPTDPAGTQPRTIRMRGLRSVHGPIQAFATALRDSAPGLIDRSYATAWRPQLIDRASRLAGEAARALAWAQRLTAGLDSSLAAVGTSDTLEARIKSIELTVDWGWNLIRPLRGTLPEDYPTLRCRILPIDRKAMTTKLPWGATIPLRPFFGILAVAPPPAWR